MMRIMAPGFCWALLLAGSAVAGTDEPILVNSAPEVAGCERLAEVKGSSLLGGAMTNVAYNRALKQLKSRATKAGATHVLLLNTSSGMAGSNMLGVAYRCRNG